MTGFADAAIVLPPSVTALDCVMDRYLAGLVGVLLFDALDEYNYWLVGVGEVQSHTCGSSTLDAQNHTLLGILLSMYRTSYIVKISSSSTKRKLDGVRLVSQPVGQILPLNSTEVTHITRQSHGGLPTPARLSR
jgi:hypothetical protein